MRFVSSLPPVPTSPNTRQVRGLTPVQAVKPANSGEQVATNLEQQARKQEPALPARQQYRRVDSFEDRRKACRRVSYQGVLAELRSGPDRRRHHLRLSDLIEHIDEIV
ncbi:MAG: hypothetical protein WAW02_11660 [Sideroxyarcus sp.]